MGKVKIVPLTAPFIVGVNTNGVPDECEPDCNANGIPDECEGQQAQGGGDGEMAVLSTPGGEEFFDEEAAWAAFWKWSVDPGQGSDPTLPAVKKFNAMIAKMQELGLPQIDPKLAAVSP